MSSVMKSLVTHRTDQDVQRNTDLGNYNYVDLNRVGEAMRYLMGRFNQYGYAVTVTSRVNWVMTDTPTMTEMTAYIRDLKALRGTFEVLRSTPPAPEDMVGLTWREANAIEQILKDVETVMQRIEASFPRSGSFMFYSGNRPLPV